MNTIQKIKNKQDCITQSELKDIMTYDSESGLFKRITSKNIRKEYAGSLHHSGYLSVVIKYKNYLLHRLAWLYMTGEYPHAEIDHIDGNKINNRFNNLRKASPQQNQQNRYKAHKQNITGLLGAHYNKANNNYRARIMMNRTEIYIGTFNTAEEAHEAYLSKKKDIHGFSNLRGLNNV